METYYYWHVFVPDLRPGQIYCYRAHGPFEPQRGLRFVPEKILLGPYSKSVTVRKPYSREAASKPGDNCATAMKTAIVDMEAYDWEDDASLKPPPIRTIV